MKTKGMWVVVTAALITGLLAGCGSSENSADLGSNARALSEEMEASGAEIEAAESAVSAAADTGADAQTESTEDNTGEDDELIVFAAASMTETLEQCADLYKQEHPDMEIVFDFDSSGTLKTQIQEGADCDLFISAAQKQMDQMDITKGSDVNTEGLDLIDPDTRVNILENKVVLTVPEGNPKQIESFDDLAEKLSEGGILMAMGNSDVPVGQYTQRILAYYGLDEDTLAQNGEITYGSNVKEVTTQVSEGLVDCGVVYCTDAASAGLTIQDYATADMCGQVIYPAAVTRNALHPEAAEDFLSFIQTDPCMEIFESVGFSPVQ